MKKIWIIARKDISEAFRSRSTYVFIFVMIILTFNYAASYTANAKNLSGQQLLNYSHTFASGMAYLLPMMYSIFVCSIFANYSVIVDKAKRNIESLMATPVSMDQIWLGKSLAVTLPSVIAGVTISILAYLLISFTVIVPNTHTFIFPNPLAILSAIVIVPLLVFTIVTIVIDIQLIIANPRIANFIFTGIFVLLIFGISALGGLGVSLNYFPLVYLGIAVLCTVISYVLSRSLTKEKVLLSSKM